METYRYRWLSEYQLRSGTIHNHIYALEDDTEVFLTDSEYESKHDYELRQTTCDQELANINDDRLPSLNSNDHPVMLLIVIFLHTDGAFLSHARP